MRIACISTGAMDNDEAGFGSSIMVREPGAAERRSMRRFIRATVASVALLPLGAPPALAVEVSPAIAQMYSAVSAAPPTSENMIVCYAFSCQRRVVLDFTAADRNKLTDIMAAGRASPEAERKALQQAVIWFDRRVGPIIGTDKRVARADFRNFADGQNFDCFDTTRNTVSLLLVLQEWSLLRHHRIGDPRYRGNILLGQLPHNTAVLIERTNGRDWVLDMWTRGYAELPDVMPVEAWLKLD